MRLRNTPVIAFVFLAQTIFFPSAFAMQIPAKKIFPIKFQARFVSQKEKNDLLWHQLKNDSFRQKFMEQTGFYIQIASLPQQDSLRCPSSQWSRRVGVDIAINKDINSKDKLHEFLNYLTLFPVPTDFSHSDLGSTRILYSKESYPGSNISIQDIIKNNGAGLYIRFGADFYPIPAQVIITVELNLEAFLVQTNAEKKLKEVYNNITDAQNSEEWFYLSRYLKLFNKQERIVVPVNFAKALQADERAYTWERIRQKEYDYAGGPASKGPYESFGIYRPWPLVITLDEEKFCDMLKEDYRDKIAKESQNYNKIMQEFEKKIIKIKSIEEEESKYHQKALDRLKSSYDDNVWMLKSFIQNSPYRE